MKPHYHKWRAAIAWLSGLAVIGTLAIGTIRDPNFWWTSEQRGDRFLRAGRFKEAAEIYRDPFRIGVAQYRNGDFEAAAKTFVRVPGAIGAYDAANALLMHGKYETAIASYDRALLSRLGWQEAEENKTIAIARQKVLEGSDQDREQESTDDDEKPDEIVIDQKGENKNTPPRSCRGGTCFGRRSAGHLVAAHPDYSGSLFKVQVFLSSGSFETAG